MNLICFGLEGPLAPRDNAYGLMKLFPRGGKIFEVISRYADLLTLEGRPFYEPGDIFGLIVPFLVCHGIEEKQIAAMGQEAGLTAGAGILIAKLRSRGWYIFCISASYEQYALPITQRLGIPRENVACSPFPRAQIRQLLSQKEFALLEETESEIVNLNPFADDTKIRDYLDYFYWQKLPRTPWGRVISQVKPIGGARSVEALEDFSTRMGKPLSGWTAVGDSITDSKMLRVVNKSGGLAVAFNGTEYALPYSTLGLASISLYDLWIVLEAWEKGRREDVERVVKKMEEAGGANDRGWLHWLDGTKDITPALKIHQRIRRLAREAPPLG